MCIRLKFGAYIFDTVATGEVPGHKYIPYNSTLLTLQLYGDDHPGAGFIAATYDVVADDNPS